MSFLVFGIGPPAENVGKSQGKRKNNASVKMAVFGPFFGPMDGHIVPKKGDHVFDIFPMFLVCFFFAFSHYVVTMI